MIDGQGKKIIIYQHGVFKLIEFGEVKGKKEVGIYIKGHAGFSQNGNDIVCAAVSAVGQTAAQGCLLKDKETKIKGWESGSLSFSCRKTVETNAIVKTDIAGLMAIKQQYPSCFY